MLGARLERIELSELIGRQWSGAAEGLRTRLEEPWEAMTPRRGLWTATAGRIQATYVFPLSAWWAPGL